MVVPVMYAPDAWPKAAAVGPFIADHQLAADSSACCFDDDGEHEYAMSADVRLLLVREKPYARGERGAATHPRFRAADPHGRSRRLPRARFARFAWTRGETGRRAPTHKSMR